jgi:hypothetical protein
MRSLICSLCARFLILGVVAPIILIFNNNQLNQHLRNGRSHPCKKGHIYPVAIYGLFLEPLGGVDAKRYGRIIGVRVKNAFEWKENGWGVGIYGF